ncbi:MAG: response regulator, partial [Acidobacteriota bacterium]
WRVHSAVDGAEGWRLWRQHRDVDVVILDRCMPGLTGDELLRRIRAEAPEVPIVVTSGFGATSLAQLRREGADAVLPKPFTARDLLQTLGGLLDGTRAAPGA